MTRVVEALKKLAVQLDKSLSKEDLVMAFQSTLLLLYKLEEERGKESEEKEKKISQKYRDIQELIEKEVSLKDLGLQELKQELARILVKEIEKITTNLAGEHNELAEELTKTTQSSIEEVRQLFKSLSLTVGKRTKLMEDRVANLKDGRDGRDGMDGLDGKDGEKGEPGKNGSPDTPVEIALKLESLEGDARLDKKAIKGLEKIEQDIIQTRQMRVSPGRSLLQLYVDGGKKGAIQYINLIAGTGVSLAYNSSHGRNDITISATGSGAFTILAATGAVDDSNTVFTFASTPTLVVVNGVAYRDGHGVTIVTTTATLDYPVGTGGDIYGIG